MTAIIVIAAFYLVFAAVSTKLAPLMISVPMAFVAFGLLIGSDGAGILTGTEDTEAVSLILEITLVLTLFADAASVSYRELRRESSVPLRLLSIGLPLTIVAGWLAGLPLLSEMSWVDVAIVATILAPTDAALGQAVVQNPGVPALVRHGLGVEGGLNDGIALPVLTLLLATAVVEAGQESSISALETFLRGLVFSGAVGAAAGAAGGWLLVHAVRRGWVAKYWRRATALAVALLAWALAVWLDGSGFIGAWAGGLVFGVFTRRNVPKACDLVEELSSILITLSFLLFGALLLGPALHRLTWQIALYGIVSLTVVRLVPVALAMIGSGLRPRSVLYMGWFGPRGLASIVFVGLVVEEALPATSAISTAVMFTVGLSVLLHGVSAPLGADAYASWYRKALKTGVPLIESTDMQVMTGARRLGIGSPDGGSSKGG